jgi:ABC-type oligopeptide transport system substrate-binding subunit
LYERLLAAHYAEIKYKTGDKQMKNKIKFGLLLLTVAALVLVPMASATPTYAKETQVHRPTLQTHPTGDKNQGNKNQGDQNLVNQGDQSLVNQDDQNLVNQDDQNIGNQGDKNRR